MLAFIVGPPEVWFERVSVREGDKTVIPGIDPVSFPSISPNETTDTVDRSNAFSIVAKVPGDATLDNTQISLLAMTSSGGLPVELPGQVVQPRMEGVKFDSSEDFRLRIPVPEPPTMFRLMSFKTNPFIATTKQVEFSEAGEPISPRFADGYRFIQVSPYG